MKFVSEAPALFNPSMAIPEVSAPSPMTAMTWWSFPRMSRASARPKAVEIDVPACAVVKMSYGLSPRLVNP